MRYVSWIVGTCIVIVLAGSARAQNGTVTEAQLEAGMKEANTVLQNLKKSLDTQMGPEATKDAQRLVAIFKDVESFWAARQKADAVQMAKDSQAAAEGVVKAVAAKDFTAALESHKMSQGLCRKCHQGYREPTPEGGFKIKGT